MVIVPVASLGARSHNAASLPVTHFENFDMIASRLARLALCAFGSTLFLNADFVQSALGQTAVAQDEPPRSLDPRLKIELFAENPQLATPTGIDVDHAGRVWTIESNTHFPPEGYKGHPTDRILVMEDTDADGKGRDHKADKITVFKDGLTHTMSIAVKPVWLEMVDGRGLKVDGQKETKPTESSPPSSPSTLNPRPSTVFIATRREILLCTDTDGDLKSDETKQLVHLETKGNYPHNGLAGFAFDALGNMFFGFGENLGADYKIIGSDGITLSGGGEGGNIYRCKPDGSKLERWATGFWNPHASCFDAFGRLFTLDNDPDSRPPCRLLHIIPGGDYGYKFRNGRKGTHPFTSWNGEIPGTLPMVSGTGEAPSGIVCYESDGFPDDYLGTLLVGSWGDHRIDKFVLKPRGASFESLPQPVIKGGENFRPVGLALAPDGSLYVTDWVLKDYKLHGKGRVWRVSAKEETKRRASSLESPQWEQSSETLTKSLHSPVLQMRRLAASLLAKTDDGKKALETIRQERWQGSRRQFEAMWARWSTGMERVGIAIDLDFDGVDLSDPFELAEATQNIALLTSTTESLKQLIVEAETSVPSELENREREIELRQIAMLLAARMKFSTDQSLVAIGLRSTAPSIRRHVVQWVGEENLKELRPEVEKVLASEPMTGELFMACLASLSMLDGVPPAEFEKAPPVQHVLPIVRDANRSASLRAIALRMLPPTLKELDGELLGELLMQGEEPGDSRPALGREELRREAVRTLGHSPIPERDSLLRGIAADESFDVNLRADAVAGLAGVDHHAKLNDATRDLLVKLLSGKDDSLAVEALRSLRGATMAKPDQPGSDAKVAEALRQLATALKIEEPGDSRPPLGKADGKTEEGLRPRLREGVAFALGQRFTEKPTVSPTSVPDPAAPQPSTLDDQPSAAAGRRVFFHTNSAGCFKCHTVGGRGGQVGPDLTVIARTMDRQKLAESILEPSKEISPQFTTWAIETKAGKVLTGMLLGEEVNGDLRLGDNTGKVFFVPFNDIETRQPLKTSTMPEKLHEQLTPTEFRDLIAYMETLK